MKLQKVGAPSRRAVYQGDCGVGVVISYNPTESL